MSGNKKLTSIQFIPVGTKEEQKFLVLYVDGVVTAQYLTGAINDDTRSTAFRIPTANMSTDSTAVLTEDGIVWKVISSSEN